MQPTRSAVEFTAIGRCARRGDSRRTIPGEGLSKRAMAIDACGGSAHDDARRHQVGGHPDLPVGHARDWIWLPIGYDGLDHDGIRAGISSPVDDFHHDLELPEIEERIDRDHARDRRRHAPRDDDFADRIVVRDGPGCLEPAAVPILADGPGPLKTYKTYLKYLILSEVGYILSLSFIHE